MKQRKTVFDRLREKHTLIARVTKLQNSALYPLLFAVICTVSGVSDKRIYIPCILVLTALSVFAGLFSPDLKVFLVPAFLVFYAIGMDFSSKEYIAENGKPSFDISSLPVLLVCLFLLLAVLTYRLIKGGLLRDMFFKRGLFFWGIILIDAALLLNGAFSSAWHPVNIAYALFTAIPLTLFYCLFLTVIGNSENGIPFACKTLVCVGLTACAQTLIIAYRLHLSGELMIAVYPEVTEHINRGLVATAWGQSTIIGAVFCVAVPAALFLARSHRFPVVYDLLALFFVGMTFFINTRSAMIIGALVFAVGVICCAVGGKNKITNRVFACILALCCIAALIYFLRLPDETKASLAEKLTDVLRFDADENVEKFFNGRLELWKRGVDDFKSAILFGRGFMSGDYGADRVYFEMYHNVVIEFLGSMGLFGIFAFAVHIKHGVEAIFRRRAADKLLLLCVSASVIGMSLADNFFFYPNFQLIYAAFLACAEISLEQKRLARLSHLKAETNEKPRVVFTYVEAGKGHIVPTRTVCDAFRRKYGDECDITESNFFTETGNPDLEKTEKLFASAVRGHNRTPVMSALCKIANLIAGDNFMLQFLLSYTFSGIKAAPLAVKHVAELEADVIFTAHWSIPYYVNKMKVPRPYTICFCPDIYSNGAFDVDCNEFLISSDAGFKKISRIRMYAGGNVRRTPFPARQEINELRKKSKAEMRLSLGLPEQFTVALSDGGYGMARLEKTVAHIVKNADSPINVIALCGINGELFEKLKKLAAGCPSYVNLIPLEYTEKITEYLAASDIYVGKGGANSIAEPVSLGIPVIITKCITYVETGIKNYYVKDLKVGLYLPNPEKAARTVCRFAKEPELIKPFTDRLKAVDPSEYDAEAIADIIWERAQRE